jgi:hypothetical protein
MVDTPQNLRMQMKGEVLEIVCGRVRDAFGLVKSHPRAKEVQAFGDRLNVIVESAGRDQPAIVSVLKGGGIDVTSIRVIPPSLENVFISLLTHQKASL